MMMTYDEVCKKYANVITSLRTFCTLSSERFLIVMLCSGKGPSLYRHELLSLHNRQNHRFSHTVDKFPVKLVPR